MTVANGMDRTELRIEPLRRWAAPGRRTDAVALRAEAGHGDRRRPLAAALLVAASLVAASCGLTDDEPPGGDPKVIAAASIPEAAAATPSSEPVVTDSGVAGEGTGEGTVERTGTDTETDNEDGSDVVASDVTYGDAEKVYRAGRYEEAADLFDAYTVRKPDNVWGHYMLGISAWKALDHERAEQALLRALEIDPEHAKSLINVSRVLLEQNRPAAALDFAEDAVVVTPESVGAWRVLGNVRSSLGAAEEAEQAYRRALVLDERDAWSMNNLGLLRIHTGRYEDAIAPLARAIELSPTTAVFQNNLGVALERSGHMIEAADAFRAALDADAGYAKAKSSLERVEGRITSGEWRPVDLESMATTFADEVAFWQERSLMEAKMGIPEDTADRGSDGGSS